MVMRTREYIQYGITGPFMNRSVPENQVPSGSFGNLVGVDGRYNGCLHKLFGMKEVVDLDGVTTGSTMAAIDAYDGPSFFKYVTFHKLGTSSIYRGFVIRWDKYDNNSKEEVSLVWTIDGSTWAAHQIWAGASSGTDITSSLDMDCVTHEGFLIVAIDTKTTKTVYWTGSALSTVSSGPGAFAATLAALTDDDTAAVDSSYNLRGNGTYQIAWRFYDSTRGIYSALSDPVSITLDIMKTTKATATITFNSGGGDSGLMVGAGASGDIFTINSRTYEYIGTGSDVTIAAAAGATVAQHCTALADAINGDTSADVYATAGLTTVHLEAKVRGAAGNAYDLSVDESAGNPDDFSVSSATLLGGGDSTTEPEEHCKAVLSVPADDAVVSGQTWTEFDALFDTVDVFRTIDLGDSVTSTGAIFYLEQTVAKTSNWDTDEAEWDAMNITIGTKFDEALPFQKQYNPETDIVAAPPTSGTIGRYQGLTFMAQDIGTRGGVDTLHSSLEHTSAEYFTTFNDRRGTMTEGRPLRYLTAGDGMFILTPNAVIHVYKAAATKPLQFVALHQERGLAGKEAAHTMGNSILMISTVGLTLLNGSDGSMGQISAVDRLLSDDWATDWSTIKSGYDALMNTSYFLHPADAEVLQIAHSTQSANLIEGANFKGVTSGPDISDLKDVRAYFITATGLIVIPDNDESGSGTMWGLDSSATGTISAYANYGGTVAGTVKATTSASHGRTTGDWVTISGTTNYNGTFQITVIDADEFYFTDTWVADDGSSTWTVAYTLNGTATTLSATKNHCIDSGATFHADMKTALLYWTYGNNAGEAVAITNVAAGDLTTAAATNAIAVGDRYAISPVPFKVRLWPLRDPDPRAVSEVFKRWNMVGLSIKVRELNGFTSNDNDKWRIGIFRNSGSTIESGTTELDVDANPADSAASLNADGIDLEPYIEQIASGVGFELTNCEVCVKLTGSREVTA